MRNAPNVNQLPKDLFTEAVIFAGADAWSHAKGWEEGMGKQVAGDTTPPVYLGPKQLAELNNLRIIDDGRRSARVYLAGDIEPLKINAIAEKLAVAGVKDARLFKGIPDREPERWNMDRLRDSVQSGESLVDMLSQPVACLPLDRPLPSPEDIYHPDHIDWKKDKVTQEWVFHKAKGTAENLSRLLNAYGVRVRYNELSRDVEISVNGDLPTGDLARNVSLSKIEDICRINDYPYTAAASHLDNLASADSYNPALDWVKSCPWDGSSRLRELFDCLTLADSEKLEISWTLFRKWFFGAAALLSGKTNKFEHVLILVDPMGGLGKTRFFNTLCPKDFQADGVTLNPDDKDSVLQVVSKWLVELGEIGATFSKSDIESLKAFLSKDKDELRPAYARAANRYQRRTAFFGSVNNVQFLMDDTNNRRFWPIQVAAVNYQHNINMQQVWAEALARINVGETWHLDQQENRVIGEHNDAFRSKDRIEEMILSMYDPNAIRSRFMSASDVLAEIGVLSPKQTDTRKASALLRKMFPNKVSRGLTVYHMPMANASRRLVPVEAGYKSGPF
ncbi:VapE family protein [Cronobacter dublinensis]|uniref:VapE domain-containing protein n=1 Tax=Cronobacter dublinensis TaxID=413497 RepID=UPI0024AF6F99|nr:VapE domain-containing protein [Cronobacter dublinensis]MDI7397589.1 VapE family protein [Cronobacter dublinensis]